MIVAVKVGSCVCVQMEKQITNIKHGKKSVLIIKKSDWDALIVIEAHSFNFKLLLLLLVP